MSPNIHGIAALMVATLGAVHSARARANDEGKPNGKSDDKVVVAKIDWGRLADDKQLPKSATIEKEGDRDVLKIVRGSDDPQLIPLATLDKPKIKEYAYRITGKVKFDGVAGDGFLEMWNHFPAPKEGSFFSRTMSETGPMGKLRGNSPWRDFVIPFFIDDKSFPMPSKLQFNLYLPEKGTVWISDVKLEEMPIEQMRKEMFGAAALPSWFGIAIVTAILIPLIIAIAVVAMVNRTRKPILDPGVEIRRMRALDIGS